VIVLLYSLLDTRHCNMTVSVLTFKLKQTLYIIQTFSSEIITLISFFMKKQTSSKSLILFKSILFKLRLFQICNICKTTCTLKNKIRLYNTKTCLAENELNYHSPMFTVYRSCRLNPVKLVRLTDRLKMTIHTTLAPNLGQNEDIMICRFCFEAIDCFTQSWSNCNNWLVPPIYSVTKAVKHLLYCRGVGTLVVPKWPSASF